MAHRIVGERVLPGDRVVDATVGNGHDTAFLATLVGEGGTVFGFDVQEEAIERTRRACASLPQVELLHAGHESMRDHIAPTVTAVMFNLGYLPSGDKAIITRPDTTLSAFEAAIDLLAPFGLLTVVVYPGHPGGKEESDAVEQWVGSLDPTRFRSLRYGSATLPDSSHCLIAIERRERDEG